MTPTPPQCARPPPRATHACLTPNAIAPCTVGLRSTKHTTRKFPNQPLPPSPTDWRGSNEEQSDLYIRDPANRPGTKSLRRCRAQTPRPLVPWLRHSHPRRALPLS